MPDLRWCNRVEPGASFVLGIGGASNARGTDAATGDPALLGYTMPAGLTMYEDGVEVVDDYPTDHFGPEVGAIDYLCVDEDGPHIAASRITVVKFGDPGANITLWKSTNHALINTTFGTAGYPDALLLVLGSNDATSALTANAYAANALDLVALFRRDRGAGLAITWARNQEALAADPYAFNSTVLAAQDLFAAGCQGLRQLLVDDLPISGDFHFTGPGELDLGRRWAMQLVEDLIITT